MLKSKLHEQTYVGSTKDLKRRVLDHNEGKEISTKRYKPWSLLYYEAYISEKLARIRERRLKYNGNALRELKKRIGLIKSGAGFTLVEMLASIIVLIAVGTIVSGIVTSSLRGSNKTTVIENIRQNGNYALAQVSKEIQYTQTFNGFSNDGTNFETTCPASFAPSLTPEVVYQYIKVTPQDNNPIIFQATSSTPSAALTANDVSLIDTNSVKLTSSTFKCIQNKATDVPIVKISFELKSIKQGSLVEFSSPPVVFETSIGIKNYKK